MAKAFQAYGTNSSRVTRATPREAATAFFEQFPTLRKCNVVEGEADGAFFTVTYGRKSAGQWPRNWKDVTKKQAPELPNE